MLHLLVYDYATGEIVQTIVAQNVDFYFFMLAGVIASLCFWTMFRGSI